MKALPFLALLLLAAPSAHARKTWVPMEYNGMDALLRGDPYFTSKVLDLDTYTGTSLGDSRPMWNGPACRKFGGRFNPRTRFCAPR